MAHPPGPAVDLARVRAYLEGINGFGIDIHGGGFSRPAFSEPDLAARRWLIAEMEAIGLTAGFDAAGNVLGRWNVGSGPAVMVGSHTDTVVSGGAFDGALGVAVGLASVATMIEAGVTPECPIIVVSTSDEEGRFGGMMGSQSLAGLARDDWLRSAVDADDVRLWEAMKAAGFDPAAVPEAALPPGSVKAFLELHIEQGPTLEQAGIPIAIADSISGVVNWSIRLRGSANHSGSTPMNMRADAFAGLAEIATAIPRVIEKAGSDYSRITIGRVEIRPNTPHTIPGDADFSVIFKETSEDGMRALCDAFELEVKSAASRHTLDFTIEQQSWLLPTTLDLGLRNAFQEEAERLGIEYLVMPSGGAHDSQTMTALCPTALVFVPSTGGISHSPREHTAWSDIEIGARLMLNGLMRISGAG